MSQWYGIYKDSDSTVTAAGFFADPGSIDPGAGNSITVGQDGEIPSDLMDSGGASNYVYNDPNVEPIA